MKKVTLLLSMLLCYLLGHSQTLYPTVSVIESGDILTINAAGETDASYFSSIFMPNQTGIIESSPDNFSSSLSIIPVGYVTYYNIVSKAPTTFKIQFKNNHPINDYTIKLEFFVVLTGTVAVTTTKTITIKIKRAPALPLTYYNDALSQTFKKNNCGSGFEGSDVTYPVPEKKYSSNISKEDANAKAQAEINANGQNKANAEGQCLTFYYNIERSVALYKNNCPGTNGPGPLVTYIVEAGKHKALTQAAADQLAINDLNANGQNFANQNGTCALNFYLKITSTWAPIDTETYPVGAGIFVNFKFNDNVIHPGIKYELQVSTPNGDIEYPPQTSAKFGVNLVQPGQYWLKGRTVNSTTGESSDWFYQSVLASF